MKQFPYSEEEFKKFLEIYENIDKNKEKLDTYTNLILGNPTNRDIVLMKKVYDENHGVSFETNNFMK